RPSDTPIPPEAPPPLDRHSGCNLGRKHALTVLERLLLEHFPARKAHDAGVNALRKKLISRGYAERYFTTGREQQHVGSSVRRVRQYVTAAGQATRRRVGRPIQSRQWLPRENQTRGAGFQAEDGAGGPAHLLGRRPSRD